MLKSPYSSVRVSQSNEIGIFAQPVNYH